MADIGERAGAARLRLIGPFRLSGFDGRLVEISNRRGKGLLAYLALAPDQSETRERLCGLFWGDRGETQARASLRQCLVDLRTSLAAVGLDILDTARERIALRPGRLETDLAALERAAAGTDDEAFMAHLDALPVGGLLEGGEIGGLFGDWLAQARTRVERWLASTVLARLEALNASGQRGLARRLADIHLRRDPCDEGVTATAIRIDMDLGADASARRRYQSLKEALAKSLGVEPGAAVREALNVMPAAPSDPGPVAPAKPLLSLPSKPSIVVLPFINLTGDAEQDFFADGVLEEIITALSRFKSLFVIASSSSLSFRGKAVGAKAAAASLGVRYVLEGSVRKAAGRVRIAVKLTDAEDETQIWADRFEDTLEDVFALEDKVALGVAGVIEPTIQGAEIQRAAARHTDNLNSYELFLRATPLAQSLGRDDVFQAISLLDRSIALDPDYGLALSLAALCHSSAAAFRLDDDPESHRATCRSLADRALRVAGDNPEVLARSANALAGIGENIDVTLTLIDRSIRLNPGSSYAWFVSARLRVMAGQPDLAAEHMETSMRLDPLSHFRRAHQLSNLGLARFQQGRFGEAIALLKESLQLLPTVPINHALIGSALGHLGRAEAAREALARYRAMSGASLDGWLNLFRDPSHRRLFLKGVALAENPRPFRVVASG